MKVTFLRQDDRIQGISVEDRPAKPAAARKSAAKQSGRAPVSTTIEDVWGPESAAERDGTSDSQFFALYLDPASKSLVVPISANLKPRMAGSTDRPDVEMRIELDALHLPGGVRSGTVRIQVNQDGKFTSGRDALYWVVAAGLDLYKAAKGGSKEKLKPGEVKADLARPFAGRPVALPSGVGYVKVEVFQDREKTPLEDIWSAIVSLFKSPQGAALATIVGFPAIGLPAVAVVDQVMDKYRQARAKPVIEGKEMRWAFTGTALERLQLGSPGIVEIPVMNPGYYVLVPAGRLDDVLHTRPRYVSGYGYLIPGDVDIADSAAMARYLDRADRDDYPYKDIPYAVIAVETRESDVWKGW